MHMGLHRPLWLSVTFEAKQPLPLWQANCNEGHSIKDSHPPQLAHKPAMQ